MEKEPFDEVIEDIKRTSLDQVDKYNDIVFTGDFHHVHSEQRAEKLYYHYLYFNLMSNALPEKDLKLIEGDFYMAVSSEDYTIMSDLYQAEKDKIKKALELIYQYGQIDGDHHKAWVLDQVVRSLHNTEEDYSEWISDYKLEDGDPEAYDWNEGVAP